MDALDNALELLGFGIGVIPIRYMDKRPLADWKKYQKELPTEQQVRGWFENSDQLRSRYRVERIGRPGL